MILLPPRGRHSRGAVEVRERSTGHVPALACTVPLRHILQSLWLAPVSTQISWVDEALLDGHCIFPLSVAEVLIPARAYSRFFVPGGGAFSASASALSRGAGEGRLSHSPGIFASLPAARMPRLAAHMILNCLGHSINSSAA